MNNHSIFPNSLHESIREKRTGQYSITELSKQLKDPADMLTAYPLIDGEGDRTSEIIRIENIVKKTAENIKYVIQINAPQETDRMLQTIGNFSEQAFDNGKTACLASYYALRLFQEGVNIKLPLAVASEFMFKIFDNNSGNVVCLEDVTDILDVIIKKYHDKPYIQYIQGVKTMAEKVFVLGLHNRKLSVDMCMGVLKKLNKDLVAETSGTLVKELRKIEMFHEGLRYEVNHTILCEALTRDTIILLLENNTANAIKLAIKYITYFSNLRKNNKTFVSQASFGKIMKSIFSGIAINKTADGLVGAAIVSELPHLAAKRHVDITSLRSYISKAVQHTHKHALLAPLPT